MNCPHCHKPIPLLTTEDVAEQFKVSLAAVRWRATVRGLGQTIGRTLVFSPEDVEAMAHKFAAGRPSNASRSGYREKKVRKCVAFGCENDAIPPRGSGVYVCEQHEAERVERIAQMQKARSMQ